MRFIQRKCREEHVMMFQRREGRRVEGGGKRDNCEKVEEKLLRY